MTDFLVDMEVKLGYDKKQHLDKLVFVLNDDYRVEVDNIEYGIDVYMMLIGYDKNNENISYEPLYKSIFDYNGINTEYKYHEEKDIKDVIEKAYGITKHYIESANKLPRQVYAVPQTGEDDDK